MRKRTEQEQDAEVIKRLQEKAPEVLEARIDFDGLVTHVLGATHDRPKRRGAPIRKRSKRN